MKKLIILLFPMLLISCANKTTNDVTYKIIDTTCIHYNYFSLFEYDVIIKMDSSYYSATLQKTQPIDIHKKLKHINEK
jgi:hypothetical protein